MQIYYLLFIFASRSQGLTHFPDNGETVIQAFRQDTNSPCCNTFITANMTKQSNIAKNSAKAWLLAARPKTLTGASVPVMIALAMAWADGGRNAFQPLPAVLCLLFAFVMQVDANFVNDYFDFASGKDDELRLGPPRACQMGWIDVAAMKRGIAVTTLVACAIGLPLAFIAGWQMVGIGILCVVFCFLYTTFMAQHALGDVLVLVFFGLVPVGATYYIQTGTATPQLFIAATACGLVVDTLLVVNNYRDIHNDKRAGKHTLIVAIGEKRGRKLYLWLGIVACMAGTAFAVEGRIWAFLLPLVYLALHIRSYRHMVEIGKGKELNTVLAETARNMFVYGIAVAAGLIIG